jgi:hypothetical protein
MFQLVSSFFPLPQYAIFVASSSSRLSYVSSVSIFPSLHRMSHCPECHLRYQVNLSTPQAKPTEAQKQPLLPLQRTPHYRSNTHAPSNLGFALTGTELFQHKQQETGPHIADVSPVRDLHSHEDLLCNHAPIGRIAFLRDVGPLLARRPPQPLQLLVVETGKLAEGGKHGVTSAA